MFRQKRTWVSRTGHEEPKPRVVFSNRLEVFACDGVRAKLAPERQRPDGFHHISEGIFLAGPEDLRPENHETLKARLAEKIKAAKALPFSEIEADEVRKHWDKDVVSEAFKTYTIPMAEHFAQKIRTIDKTYWLSDDMRKAVDDDRHIYHLLEDAVVSDFKNDFHKLHSYLKTLFTQLGKEEEFAALELRCAKENLRGTLQESNLSASEINRLVENTVMIKEGELHYNSAALEAQRKESIDRVYQNLDKIIGIARREFVRRSEEMGITKPFEYTAEEKARIEEIDRMANLDTFSRPLVKAGYNNPELTIVVERFGNLDYAGISYERQNCIKVCTELNNLSFYNVVVEELMHQGLDRIYGNDSLPYGGGNDKRKALFEAAAAKDMETFPQMPLVLRTRTEDVTSPTAQKELPVKLLQEIDRAGLEGLRKEVAKPNAYRYLMEYMQNVLLQDARDFNEKRKLPEVREDFCRQYRSPESPNLFLRS